MEAGRGLHGERGLRTRGRALLMRLAESGVRRGVNPRWVGYRHLLHETVPEYFERHRHASGAGDWEIVHAPAVTRNPLPCNVASIEALPRDPGWWGYAFADVPARACAETFVATLPRCRVVWYRDASRGHDFYPAILNADARALQLREVRFRPAHADVLRSRRPIRIERATWILERVYHNHSHWLSAHLPKILLLRQRGALQRVLLPRERPAALDGSLRLLGLDPEEFATFDPEYPLEVEQLTIVGNDRFRPELMRLVRRAYGAETAPPGRRRVFISREGAARRRLVNEDEVWAVLREAGFERLRMEDMNFAEQVRVMRETAVLAAPHGAGLTNMLFCPPGTDVIELADLTFPNPNFYALASAAGLRYWLVPGEGIGDGHPLQRDLRADVRGLRDCLARLSRSEPGDGTSRTEESRTADRDPRGV